MPTPLPVILIGLTIALIAVFVFRPQITQTLAGKMAAFLALFALPVLCGGVMDLEEKLQQLAVR